MALPIIPDVASNTAFENELMVAKFTLRVGDLEGSYGDIWMSCADTWHFFLRPGLSRGKCILSLLSLGVK